MLNRWIVLLMALSVSLVSHAQEKKRIDKESDLPRFTCKVDGISSIVRDSAAFGRFEAEMDWFWRISISPTRRRSGGC